jgi:acetylornithine/succinyldiaminopimelate/putrescine aminotransferase
MVCAAGCAVIDVMKRDGIVAHAKDLGARWREDIRAVGSPRAKEVRGYGLIIGIEMDSNESASHVQKYCRDNGVLVNVCHGNTVRLIPPLILSDGEKDRFTALFKECAF